MNWYLSDPTSVDSVLQAGLRYLEVVCALVGVIAVLMLLIALLHIIFAIRWSNSQADLHRFGEETKRAHGVPPTPTPRKKLLHVGHVRG
jgi:hypothetical protein